MNIKTQKNFPVVFCFYERSQLFLVNFLPVRWTDVFRSEIGTSPVCFFDATALSFYKLLKCRVKIRTAILVFYFTEFCFRKDKAHLMPEKELEQNSFYDSVISKQIAHCYTEKRLVPLAWFLSDSSKELPKLLNFSVMYLCFTLL